MFPPQRTQSFQLLSAHGPNFPASLKEFGNSGSGRIKTAAAPFATPGQPLANQQLIFPSRLAGQILFPSGIPALLRGPDTMRPTMRYNEHWS